MAYEETGGGPPPEEQQQSGGPLSAEQLASMTAQEVANAVRGRTPTVAELRAMKAGQSEDFGRFSDAEVQAMLNTGLYDVNVQRFRSAKTDEQGNPLEGFVDKPDETPEGWYAWGENMARRSDMDYGGPSGPGGPSQPTTGFNAQGLLEPPTPFVAPSYEDAVSSPGFQFRLNQGREALEGSAAARGTLRSGGTLQDILDYGQEAASQEYQNVYNRDLAAWQSNLQPWQTQYQGNLSQWTTGQNNDLSRWTTGQNANLQRYLNRENNIFGLLNQPPPSY